MSVTAPETTARAALRGLLQTEFAPEGFPVLDDRLHESIGREGTQIGTSPIRARPFQRSNIVLVLTLFVQFYGRWRDEIDNYTRVDPVTIETYAERFRRALRTSDPDVDAVWYFNLDELAYPSDPTGNITRFEATVQAFGNNPALIETTG